MGARASMGLAEPALEGRIFTSLGFQPQVVGGAPDSRRRTIWSHRLARLGLKPQAIEYPPFQGGQGCARAPKPPYPISSWYSFAVSARGAWLRSS
jgi:hypothetical protein